MPNNKLKATGIFLDLDGTIVDSTPAYIEAAKIAYRVTGQKPPKPQTTLEIPRRLEQGLKLDDLTGGKTKEFLEAYFSAYYNVSGLKTQLLSKSWGCSRSLFSLVIIPILPSVILIAARGTLKAPEES